VVVYDGGYVPSKVFVNMLSAFKPTSLLTARTQDPTEELPPSAAELGEPNDWMDDVEALLEATPPDDSWLHELETFSGLSE
jgi:hypothetical protein